MIFTDGPGYEATSLPGCGKVHIPLRNTTVVR